MVLLSLYAFLFGAVPYAVTSSLVFWDASSKSDYDMDSNQFMCSHTTLLIILIAKHLYGHIVSAQYQCTVCQHKPKKAHNDQPNSWQHVRCSTTWPQ